MVVLASGDDAGEDQLVRWFDTERYDTPASHIQRALDRLIKRYPDRRSDLIASMLADAQPYIVMHAAGFSGATGDRERYGLRVFDQLTRADQSTFEFCAEAAGRLDVVEAVPLCRVACSPYGPGAVNSNRF
jgi:hypothetical protein